MKKTLRAAAFFMTGVLLSSSALHAQITPERNYTSLVYPGKLSTGDVKYVGYSELTTTTGQIKIYNANHSIYKQVNVTVPAGATVEDITYLSDKLFNPTAGLEFVLNMRNVSATVYGGMRIIDENGAVLFARDSTSYPEIYNTPAGTKMLLNYYSDSMAKVYGLSGTLTALAVAPKASSDALLPYPNPTAADIRLPYSVATGQVAQLIVRDVTGRQMSSYQVDSAFDHLLFSTRGLRPGIYFYTVANGPARRFTVQ